MRNSNFTSRNKSMDMNAFWICWQVNITEQCALCVGFHFNDSGPQKSHASCDDTQHVLTHTHLPFSLEWLHSVRFTHTAWQCHASVTSPWRHRCPGLVIGSQRHYGDEWAAAEGTYLTQRGGMNPHSMFGGWISCASNMQTHVFTCSVPLDDKFSFTEEHFVIGSGQIIFCFGIVEVSYWPSGPFTDFCLTYTHEVLWTWGVVSKTLISINLHCVTLQSGSNLQFSP